MGLVDAKVSAPAKDAPGSAVGAAVPPRDPQAHSHASEALTLSLDFFLQRPSGSLATQSHRPPWGLFRLTQSASSTQSTRPATTCQESEFSHCSGYTGCGFSRR